MKTSVVVSCEHGGNNIPVAYARLFRGQGRLLASHRGWDIGAASLARAIARALDAELVIATTSRLLVDLNRSPGHPARFSRFTRALPIDERRAIDARWYEPYRREVERLVTLASPTLHLSIHSFTPVLAGEVRNADIGLLYDPSRPRERRICDRIQGELRGLRVRRNYPYRGTADGLAQSLRRRLSPRDYVGVEIEVNQRHAVDAEVRRALVLALAVTSGSHD